MVLTDLTPEQRYEITKKHLTDLGVVLEAKESKWYWRFLGTLLTIISFGNIDFSKTVTTIGKRIGLPKHWNNYSVELKYELLLHEEVHVRQYMRFGFGNAWLGVIPVGFAYLFLPLPIGLAWCRAKLEQEAYEQSIRAIIQTKGLGAALLSCQSMTDMFTTSAYLWMWPFREYLINWHTDTVMRIYKEEYEGRPRKDR